MRGDGGEPAVRAARKEWRSEGDDRLGGLGGIEGRGERRVGVGASNEGVVTGFDREDGSSSG